MLENMLMQKAGLATQDVARALAGYEEGDRVPTVTQLAEQFGTARGNIQYALANLKKLGAIELKARGHLGTYLVAVDYMLLAATCGMKGVVGVMPLPYSKRFEGLATGIYSCLNSGQQQGNIAFMRGSRNRLEQLLQGRYDFVVMSRLALHSYLAAGEKLAGVADFGPRSYVEQHVVLVRPGFAGSWQGKRVGLDENSIDQKALTLQYFAGQNVEYLPLAYNQFMRFLADGTIDACIWNTDGEKPPRGVGTWQDDAKPLDPGASHAVVACRAGDALVRRILQQQLNSATVCRQQQEVITGQRVPRY